ncbi:type I polyketide synthase [Burkholderia gladioli]|uniref:type I polyketide synthase n=1 Tax=Burkholderia gladioli TaxID=28095 RepID=UPI000BF18C2A|nr:type I polyketide synthase [Burkholderia gladioli]PEH82520.1 beta-ketoacyl synthase [Burkholderia gladioli]
MQGTKRPESRIAITGTAYRFPGDASDHESYWDLLESGRAATRETPKARFDIEPFFNEDASVPGTTYARHGGYVDGAFEFDPGFFRISESEALAMDPQQRWLLELCWQALENAGIAPGKVRGQRIGVFLGSGEVDYGRRTMWAGDMSKLTAYARLGASRATLAGRIAYFLGVHGPAVFVDTACSSSLTAVHLAAQSLRADDCDIAIAGGINLILSPEETIAGARLQAMAHGEICRPFDARADGYLRGEGGGVVVLKRIEDASHDGDRIDAVLAGSAINNDGASNGMTAPNGVAQESAIRVALQRAGVGPESIAYVEAHGTGTQLGDPIELTALRNVYTSKVERRHPLLVGSVKAQIGHLEAGAGIAGLIKAILVLRRGRVPRQANFEVPTSRFRWDGSGIGVPRASEDLPGEDAMVGVNSFGISGTNVHLVLAKAPAGEARAEDTEYLPRVLPLSAKTREAVARLARAYRHALEDEGLSLHELCYTASTRRDHWSHRAVVVGETREQLSQALDDFLAENPEGEWHAGSVTKTRRLVFLFPGQGAWKPGVGAELHERNALFRGFVDECLGYLDAALAADVLAAIRGEQPETVRHRAGQLAHFVMLHSLARTWIALGNPPDAVVGHSLGEHVAATLAGVMSLEDGLKAVEARGRLFDTATPPGAMLAVAASVAELRERFEFGEVLFVAGINGPEQTVVSGTADAVEKVHAAMLAMGRRASVLSTYDTPGHSPLLAPMRPGFDEVLSTLRFSAPRIELVSTLTGRRAGDDIASSRHWLDLVEQPVLFADALQQFADQDCVFLEVGPGAALSNLARAATQKWDQAVSSLADAPGDDATEAEGFAHACARLYCLGFLRNWAAFYPRPPQPAEVPTYPFERVHLELPGIAYAAASAVEAPALPRELAKAGQDSARPAHDGAPVDQARLLDTIRRIVQSVASGAVVLEDEAPLVACGLDSLALTELRSRLQQTFGRALPVALLARGVSIAKLAGFFGGASAATPPAVARLASGRSGEQPLAAGDADPAPVDESLIVLRQGRGELVALVHPVGGDVLCYQELAEAWPGEPTVVGLRHPDVDRAALAVHRPLAELANWYRVLLERSFGRLPDRLGGWSFGGLVSLEMAAQWEAAGQAMAPLMLIDSPFPSGDFASRLKAIVGPVAGQPTLDGIDALSRDARFIALLDRDLGLAQMRDRVDAAEFARISRLYASSVVSIVSRSFTQLRTPIHYALAARGSNAGCREDALPHLRVLSTGPIEVAVFDDDHNSIVTGDAARRLAALFNQHAGVDAEVEVPAETNGR